MSTYDFPEQADGKAIPHGIYDLAHNSAWVSVGIDHDTSVFAVTMIDKWWQHMRKKKWFWRTLRERLVSASRG